MVLGPRWPEEGAAAQAEEADDTHLPPPLRFLSAASAVASPQYQRLIVDDTALGVADLLLTNMPRKGARKELRRLPCLINDLLPYVRLVLQEMASRTEALAAARGPSSWQEVWKPMSEHGYDTLRGGTVSVDYGNREYSAVLAVFAALDAEVMLCLERMARYWPSVSPLQPYTEKACEMRGDVVEVFFARIRGHGEEEFGGYLEGQLLPLARTFCELMRLVQMIDSWDTTWLKWKQVEVQPMRLALRKTVPFLDHWAEGSHCWPSLLLALYRLQSHLDQLGS